MAFANLTAKLNLNITDFSSKLSQASEKMTQFTGKLSQSYGKANEQLKSHNLGLKDTARIMQGIVVAQAFYRITNAIQEATSAVWEFNKQLDYAQVTYSALFGDASLASDFMSALQEHSIETIFDYQDLSGISKKLLAYGIDYKNLMFVMEGLTNLGTMSGDAAALDRIALALGQIYTKGKLSAEEMRQLANAYVPITEIIQSKFGLSEEDLGRVGDLNLPAEEVINAIIDYANENFGSVGDAAMLTITGLEAKIVDTLKVVGAEMLEPITTAYKSFLVYIADGLTTLREEFTKGGIGGVFEYFVPDENLRTIIRTFLANVSNLFKSFTALVAAGGSTFVNAFSALVSVFNIVAPVITNVINALAIVTQAIATTSGTAAILRTALVLAAGAFVLMKVQAIGALVVTAVTKVINGLSKALLALSAVIRAHPIFALFALLGVTLGVVAVNSDKANSSISKFFNGLSGGLSGDDVLKNVNKELETSVDESEQFNNRLEESNKSAKELEDSIKGVGKAAKKTGDLLSFDEVFKLNESSAGGGIGTGALGDLTDLQDLMEGLSGLADGIKLEIPDFSEYASDFVDNLFGSISDDIKEKIASGSVGSLIGAAIGAGIGLALKNPKLGATIGAALGALFGVAGESIEFNMTNSFTGAFAGIGAAIMKALGAEGLELSLKNVLSLGASGAKSAVKGGIAGAIVGLVADVVAYALWDGLEQGVEGFNADDARIGQTVASIGLSIIGGIAGSFLLPGVGTVIGSTLGSVLGTFLGGYYGGFFESTVADIAEWLDPENNPVTAWLVKVAEDIGTWVSDTASQFGSWAVDTYNQFDTWATDTYTKLDTWWSDTWSGFDQWWEDTKSGLSTWWDDTVKTFSDWDNITSTTLDEWWKDTTSGFNVWWADTTKGFSTWWTNTTEGFSTWWDDTGAGFSTWWTETSTGFSTWWDENTQGIKDWADETGNKISTWVTDTKSDIDGWIEETKGDIKQWVGDQIAKFQEFATGAGLVIGGFGIAIVKDIGMHLEDFKKKVDEKLGPIKEVWDTFWEDVKKAFGEWWSSMGTSTDDWLDEYLWKPISDFFDLDNFWSKLSGKLRKITDKIAKWWEGLGGLFSPDADPSNPGLFSAAINKAYSVLSGHEYGGIFNKEHIARFAEGNKAEAVIPLENARAMQPFVDAVSNGIISSLAPVMVNAGSGNNSLPPMYVGTLVADERGLRQLYKKFEVIKVQEDARRGVPMEVF